MKDGINEDASVTTFHSTPGWGNGTEHAVAANAPAKNLRYTIKGGYWFGMDAGAGVVTAVNPAMHCAVNRLTAK
ncbi:hypothetical protein [Aeromicrobium duanguangcaii]|uniref:Uncharacterized protein n=1 Tax=Aeromicrobium duanguangcaii TaxID=2968086 RepID=A0ABY5KGU9_9ACTN|nr:hypothetical protein [Aeromicrobium duanguangcaii]MCD9154582.1 hypothetical protein [Aeromicrobium duanguangcaii]UUI68362.1 hypothetical protein NP095_14310 [Aeromicrobium duanguangcaii]